MYYYPSFDYIHRSFSWIKVVYCQQLYIYQTSAKIHTHEFYTLKTNAGQGYIYLLERTIYDKLTNELDIIHLIICMFITYYTLPSEFIEYLYVHN